MARYIKATPAVAEFLGLENDRNTVGDGNYILWQSDMLAFGPLTRLSETLAAIGGIALMPHEAREEQDGVRLRPLPEATDPRFAVPAPEPVGTSGPEAPAEPVEDSEETESQAEETAEEPDQGDAEETSGEAMPDTTDEPTKRQDP